MMPTSIEILTYQFIIKTRYDSSSDLIPLPNSYAKFDNISGN